MDFKTTLFKTERLLNTVIENQRGLFFGSKKDLQN